MKQRNRNDMLSQLQFLGMYVPYEDSCNKAEKIIKYFSAHVSYRYAVLEESSLKFVVRTADSPNKVSVTIQENAKLKADFVSFKAKPLNIEKLV